MPGKYMRGALVEFQAPTFLVPVPNVIVFQYNPETITHTWTQPVADTSAPAGGSPNPLAVKGVPGESFSLTIAMDSSDTIADGSVVTAGIAQATGVYSRLAALEMLQYPSGAFSGSSLVGSVSASVSVGGVSVFGSSGGQADVQVPKSTVPVVLFVWGPG
ncbi:MAG TPA: hypothetical protein VIX89_06785, partial [Bryobacteraceae bacterium]